MPVPSPTLSPVRGAPSDAAKAHKSCACGALEPQDIGAPGRRHSYFTKRNRRNEQRTDKRLSPAQRLLELEV